MLLRALRSKDREEGFTLIELLVVILVIGILSAIAIPAFMNQRKAAADAATQSDMKNVATAIETGLVKYPSAQCLRGPSSSNRVDFYTAYDFSDGAQCEGELMGTVRFTVSEGVTVAVWGNPNSTKTTPGFTIQGWNDGGTKNNLNSAGQWDAANRYTYHSGNGGLKK